MPAEFTTVAEHAMVAAIPPSMTFAEIAPATEGSHYALACIRKAKIGPGDDVLVYGATGAIGSAAVQLLKAQAVTVAAVCAAEHLALVEGLGADRLVDYTVEDFTRDAQTYDVVFDAVGKSTFGSCRRLLRPGGIYLTTDLGPFAQNPFLALATSMLRRKRVMMAARDEGQEIVRDLQRLLESGQFDR